MARGRREREKESEREREKKRDRKGKGGERGRKKETHRTYRGERERIRGNVKTCVEKRVEVGTSARGRG